MWPILNLTGKYVIAPFETERVNILYSQVNIKSVCLEVDAIMVHRKTDSFQFMASERKSICMWDWLNRSHYFIVTFFLHFVCLLHSTEIFFTKSFYRFQKSVFCPDSVNLQGSFLLFYLYCPLEMALSSLSSPHLLFIFHPCFLLI